VLIGEFTTINRSVTLDGRGGLKIGSRVSVSEGVKILTASHEVNSESFNLILKSVVIDDYVWIGANAIILPGVFVGYGAVVGSGSVVVKNVEPLTVVCGNPAKVVSIREGNLNYDPTWKPLFF
jgi:acetyltransferase-like isoleucine patch superfamily enzyme